MHYIPNIPSIMSFTYTHIHTHTNMINCWECTSLLSEIGLLSLYVFNQKKLS